MTLRIALLSRSIWVAAGFGVAELASGGAGASAVGSVAGDGSASGADGSVSGGAGASVAGVTRGVRQATEYGADCMQGRFGPPRPAGGPEPTGAAAADGV